MSLLTCLQNSPEDIVWLILDYAQSIYLVYTQENKILFSYNPGKIEFDVQILDVKPMCGPTLSSVTKELICPNYKFSMLDSGIEASMKNTIYIVVYGNIYMIYMVKQDAIDKYNVYRQQLCSNQSVREWYNSRSIKAELHFPGTVCVVKTTPRLLRKYVGRDINSNYNNIASTILRHTENLDIGCDTKPIAKTFTLIIQLKLEVSSTVSNDIGCLTYVQCLDIYYDRNGHYSRRHIHEMMCLGF